MKKLTNHQKLRLIDGICLLYQGGIKDLSHAEKIIDQIYRVAHPYSKCQHNDWEIEASKLKTDLELMGIL